MSDQYNEKFFERSFNEEMLEIGKELENIIRSGEKQKIKVRGRENYENTTVAGLFHLTRSDPKNLGIMRELRRAEQEIMDFLYDAPGACSKDDLLAYWRGYRDSTVAEAQQHAPYYFLMRGHEDWNHDGDNWIGIFRAVNVLQQEYNRANDKLEEEKSSAEIAFGKSCSKALSEERVMIHAFDEVDGKWYYDIKPETLFASTREDCKEVEVVLDSGIMYQWRLFCAKKTFGGYWL